MANDGKIVGLGLAALAGLAPPASASQPGVAPDSRPIERLSEIRGAYLRAIDDLTWVDLPPQHRQRFAQYFPNFPNFGNFPNWGNGWRNY
ncbi:hypothetical protein [Bosea sp. BK604]|uniref:hypothetical protein n=1 Tax=Bosea sp. BK604 TaxID=2512180 RepID=UPI00104F8429|nr:hypothetical protein [Bosea sp. BK604]